MLNDTDIQAEVPVDAPHPFGIPASQIIVDRHHVNAGPCEGVEVYGKGGDEGLPLTGLHLGDLPLVENNTAEDLDVEMPHTEKPYRRLPDHGEGLREQFVQRFPLLQSFPELPCFSLQGSIIQGLHRRFKTVDLIHNGSDPLKLPLVPCAEDLLSDEIDH